MNQITWSEILDAFVNDKIFDVEVIEATAAGATVELGGITAFMPINKLLLQGETIEEIQGQTIRAKIKRIAAINANIIMYRYEKTLLDNVETSAEMRKELVEVYIKNGLLKVGDELEGQVINIERNKIKVQLFEKIRGSLHKRFVPESMELHQYSKVKVKILNINLKEMSISLGLPGMEDLSTYDKKAVKPGATVECIVTQKDANRISFELTQHNLLGSHTKNLRKNNMMYDFLKVKQKASLIVSNVSSSNSIVYFDFNDTLFKRKRRTKLKENLGNSIPVHVAATDNENVVIILYENYIKLPITTFDHKPEVGEDLAIKVLSIDEGNQTLEIVQTAPVPTSDSDDIETETETESDNSDNTEITENPNYEIDHEEDSHTFSDDCIADNCQ